MVIILLQTTALLQEKVITTAGSESFAESDVPNTLEKTTLPNNFIFKNSVAWVHMAFEQKE